MKFVILIPARLGSSRLPNKPLAEIAGVPMIVQVWRRAAEARLGPVVVAAAEMEIAEAVQKAGGEAILTDPAHPSGTDRAFEALTKFDPQRVYDGIINLQGDLPTLEPHLITRLAQRLAAGGADIVTLAAEIKHAQERNDPNVVKPILSFGTDPSWARALYFTRATAPSGAGPLYHHIGIYGYRRAALDRFKALAPSALEIRERLEQLRALEAGMTVEVGLVDSVPVGVDTAADLERARQMLAARRPT